MVDALHQRLTDSSYIHGGAFRDPLQDSPTIVPTLSHLFETSSPDSTPQIYAFASLNYRLSPYPSHPTNPSSPDDPARNAKWPDHLDDVKAGIQWVLEHGEKHDPRMVDKSQRNKTRDYILAGHSVGGTMTLKIAHSGTLPFPHPIAALSLCGIYDFTSLRDAHASNRQIYNDFTTGAFGPEEEGGWERGSTATGVVGKVRVLNLARSRTDTLVEWEQTDTMAPLLDSMAGRTPKLTGVITEIHGDHKEIYEKGTEIAKSVTETVGLLKQLRLC